MRSPVLRVLLGALVPLIVLAACAGESGPPDLSPPDGWTGADGRWWQPGADTARAFRDLETLEAMGVAEEVTYTAGGFSQSVARERLAYQTKRSLIELYRNDPAVVDSLFERYVAPKIAEADVSGDLGEAVQTWKERGYDAIRNHFREPRTRLRLGEDVQIAIPDSLREAASGAVGMQVYVDAEGTPQAIELLEGVHPVLDAIALRAATEMRWQPAYVRGTGNWREVPSWVRYRIVFSRS